jgi:hypothetical protein
MRRSGAQVERDYERGKWCAETKLFFFKKKKKPETILRRLKDVILVNRK